MDQNISAAPDDVQETDKNDMNLNAPDSALLTTGSGGEADKLLVYTRLIQSSMLTSSLSSCHGSDPYTIRKN